LAENPEHRCSRGKPRGTDVGDDPTPGARLSRIGGSMERETTDVAFI
jgi:hypothetical protein